MIPPAASTRPWYRQPLVLMLIALPASVVIASFFTLYLAISSNDGLVEDDYYQRGKEINRVLDRDRAAARYGLQARLRLDDIHHVMRMQLTAVAPIAPARLAIKLMHSTRSGLDHHIVMTRENDGGYTAPLPALAPGRWYLQLSDADWRLSGEMRMPTDSVATLAPTP